ncbi:CRISPR-associated protein, TIGR02710 family [Methanobrevibacter olleyae]|uniref:CRISPR-associated protein, TIGR02710 family n=1 Tax=Methanobrevibacter olleyae TaxID=294671 RepID=A0A1I4JXL9_METOL|nr:TIGR02710 family CRISPR-associated CARF protein [Methanobrevibacter olleyae]SFL70856.1 CRISPR-associated protein, TIGR02710 family [Methanobrevibacter olleyae]
MKRKTKTLFMTVGTGINPNSDIEGHKRLAKGIYASLHKIYPDYIIFFASELSQNTIKYIKELFEADDDEFIEGEDYEIVVIEQIDNFNHCFEAFEAKIWQFDILSEDKGEIIMDYTSGTKTMSAAMACCGMFYSKDLITVSGDRKNGIVSLGTESIQYQNLYKVYDRFSLMRVRNYFNANRFYTAGEILENIVDTNIHKEDLLNLVNAYYAWDNMDFDIAYDYLTKVNLDYLEFAEIRDDLKINLKALGTIVRSPHENLKNCYILASLINNSIRRADEYKYDDAIARLYRSFELIAQIRLNSYCLISSDIDISILLEKGVSEDFIKDLEKTRLDGKIKIGLIKDFELLAELDDDLGKYFIENRNKINNLTQNRNNSILAHGLESLNKEDFDKFEELVENLAHKLDKDMAKFLKETKFAKFDLRLKLNRI